MQLPQAICKKGNGIKFCLFESYLYSTDTYMAQYRNVYWQKNMEINGDVFLIENEDMSLCRAKLLELINKHKEELILTY